MNRRGVMVYENEKRSNGMRDTAREIEAFYERPMPDAREMSPLLFGMDVMSGLWLGALIGAGLGLIWGLLLLNGIIVIPGWEQLYSLLPFPFVVFWGFIGLALGIAVGGAIGLLTTPVPQEIQEMQREKE